MSYGWLYDHVKPWHITAVAFGLTILIGWRYGLLAALLAKVIGMAHAFYVIRLVEESDVEEADGLRPWVD